MDLLSRFESRLLNVLKKPKNDVSMKRNGKDADESDDESRVSADDPTAW